jgi:thiamine-monophosphate kinase
VYRFFVCSGEAALINRIARSVPSVRGLRLFGEVHLGIGDDAALLHFQRRAMCAVSCDPFIENIHFFAGAQPAVSVGYKSLARATSDLAAMGAAPRFFLLSLAMPGSRTGAWLNSFLRGLARAAREFRMRLIGGDVAKSPHGIINITVFGETAPGGAILRSGARPGDWIYVSGRLGCSQLGLELILRNLHRRNEFRNLLRAHFRPAIRIALGRWLAANRIPSAMMDLSDGLSTDLARLCAASKVGARIELNRLPLCSVPATLRSRGLDPLHLALHGGEDYELLFTVSPNRARKLPPTCAGVPLTCIGEILPARNGMCIQHPDGRISKLPSHGWDHFR